MGSYNNSKLKNISLWNYITKFNFIMLLALLPEYIIKLIQITKNIKIDSIIFKILVSGTLTIGIGIFFILIISLIASICYYLKVKRNKDTVIYINKQEIIYKKNNIEKHIKYNEIQSVKVSKIKYLYSSIIVQSKTNTIVIKGSDNDSKIIKELLEKFDQYKIKYNKCLFDDFIKINKNNEYMIDVFGNAFERFKRFYVITLIIIALICSVIFVTLNLDLSIIAIYPILFFIISVFGQIKKQYEEEEFIKSKKTIEYIKQFENSIKNRFIKVSTVIGIITIVLCILKATHIL